jgi:hypothetical protein
MTGARHAIVNPEEGGAWIAGTASCACGATGQASTIIAHVQQYAVPVDPIAVKVGRIRNAQLTRDRERTHMELDGLEGRVFVLVALPAATRLEDALAAAESTLSRVIAGTPEAARERGVI